LLTRFSDEGLTYIEVEKKVGVSQATIRKWAKRYAIELDSGDEGDEPENNIRELFFSPSLNIYNILSRRWQVAS
jgi:hypothetical protein